MTAASDRPEAEQPDAADRVSELRARLDSGVIAESDERAPSRRVAAGLRALIEEFVAAEVPADLLEQAIAQLAGLRRSIAASPRRPSRWAAPPPDGRRGAPSDWLPVAGACNPLAPPATFHVEDGLVVGEATYGAAYEGPPGCVHGGMIAAAFDEVLGLAQSLSGQFGMTGTLSVRYRRPTPLHVPLRLEGRYEGMERRKILTTGRILVDGEVTATAEAVFVALDQESFLTALASAPGAAAGNGR
jgi:acyl-coenzyme A thioesterase PaaI-like protein